MKEYKFLLISNEKTAAEINRLINDNVDDPEGCWEVCSHSADRYWGVTVIMGREKQ